MADCHITKKSRSSFSITLRMVSVSILLLVIPLFLHNLFLYRQEYQERLSDVKTDLQLLAEERAHLVSEMVRMDWELLDSWDASLGARGRFVERIPTPQGVTDHFLLLSQSREALLVGVKEGYSSFVIPVPLAFIGRDMPRAYPVHIALVNQQGKTLWGNQAFPSTGDFLQAQHPILGTDLSIHLKVRQSAIRGLHLASYYWRFASLVFFVGVIGGLFVYLLTRRISRPLQELIKTMQRVSEGAVHARYTPDKMGFEINQLGVQFNETLDALLKQARMAEEERIRRERLAREFHIGHEIQANLLPKHVPGLAGVDIATYYSASTEVNGDFYDLFLLKNGHLFIAMSDVAGKGIQACLFSLGLRSILRSIASMTTDLAEIVLKANDLYLMDAHDLAMFATLWVGLYDPKKKILSYSSQGHPPAILLRKGGHEELWTEGIAMGAQTMDGAVVDTVKLQVGDSLILYTDGMIEAHNMHNELFGKKRFQECLVQEAVATAQQVVDRTVETVHLFAKGVPQHDDMTLLAMRLFRSARD